MKKVTYFLIFALLLSLCACGKAESAPVVTPPAEEAEPSALPLLPESPEEAEEAPAEGISWHYEDGTLTVSGKGDMEDYSLFTAPWDEAGHSFSVNKLVVEEGVVSLGKFAFAACCNLTEVSLPSSLRMIGESCFADCGALRSILLPEGLMVLDARAFTASGLESLTLPSTLAYIGEAAFANCIALGRVTAGECLLQVGDGAFLACEELTIGLPTGSPIEGRLKELGYKIEESGIATGQMHWSGEDWKLEKGVLSVSMDGDMPDYAASGAKAAPWNCLGPAIERIELTGDVRSIGDYSFWNCTECLSLSLPEGLEIIGDYAFGACGQLQALALPSTLKSIGYGAFSFCSSLKELTLPEGIESVGVDAFVNCSGISEVNKPDSLKDIGAGAFNFAGENTGELTG